MEKASDILSSALLRGMTMTNKECSQCRSPLMRPRNSKEASCLVCEELGTPAQTLPETVPESLPEPKAAQVSQPTAEDAKSRASELIGQKMLQGWTMLQEYCQNPNCVPVPLVRNMDKISVCVLCNTQYLREIDFDKNIHSKLNLINENNHINYTNTTSASTNSISNSNNAQTIENKAEPVTSTTLPEVTNLKNTLANTINEKLIQLNQDLKNNQDIKEIQTILSCIDQAITTLNNCKKL